MPDASNTSTPAGPQASDYLQRFYFEDLALRGAVVKLSNSFIESINGRDYPKLVKHLLGECLAASVLMSTNLKRATRLSLQARGEGALSLLMAEAQLSPGTPGATAQQGMSQTVRALARLDASAQHAELLAREQASLQALLGRAQLAITIEPLTLASNGARGKTPAGERYQGIVGLDHARLDRCLEHYFLRSEQLPTFLKLHAQGDQAAGLLLQKIPSSSASDGLQQVADDSWEEITVLASSLQNDELLELPAANSLHRLFHAHSYRLAAAQPVAFACSCSATRTGAALMHIDPREIEQILAEDGEIVMDCEFCSARYRFDRAAIDSLSTQQSSTRH
ncbi:MAG: redox-regulated molecular chaperone Hsp33 [Pseudomonadales bacterium]|nr:Hsp33 family molecular chaperone HslO [Gammaproteobacteria bacterium]NNL57508.1 redox-regulated molecular chaperone Hsp33 [Pseudomonadales bacterium]